MYKIIDYKKVRMSDIEHKYYKHLIEAFRNKGEDGEGYFKDLLEIDEDGFITLIKTDKNIPWVVLFFVQQLMISQRLNLMENFAERFKEAENKINKLFKLIEKRNK